MLPNVSFLGLDLYAWMIVVGVIAAMVLFRVLYRRVGLPYSVFLLTLLVSFLSVITGYLSAILFESFFEYLENGVFVWGTGATFYGGLIGAAVTFLPLYFLIGHFLCRNREHIAKFDRMLSLIAPCIALAHAFGRIGCLFGGCCYGPLTDSFLGIVMNIDGAEERRIPLQLYESLFLFALSALLILLLLKERGGFNGGLYLILYGAWRFAVEFFRADDRGASGIPALSPAQLISIIFIILGAVYILLRRFLPKQKDKQEEPHEET